MHRRPTRTMRSGARGFFSLLLGIAIALTLANASDSATLTLDFDVAPDGSDVPVGQFAGAGTPPAPTINEFYRNVGVGLWMDVDPSANPHICNNLGGADAIRADGDHVLAADPLAGTPTSGSNVVSPCETNGWATFSELLGFIVAEFDNPATDVCIQTIMAAGGTERGILEAYTGAPGSSTLVDEVEEADPCVSAERIDFVRFTGRIVDGKTPFFDDLEVTFDREIVDFNLDPDGEYLLETDDLEQPTVINDTYASLGAEFSRTTSSTATCGTSNGDVYVRASDGEGPASNTASLNATGEVPFDQSDGWIKVALTSFASQAVCVYAEVDAVSSSTATLIAYDVAGSELGSDVESVTSRKQLCVYESGIRCVRFTATGGDPTYFDDLYVEGLPEPALEWLGAVALATLAWLRGRSRRNTPRVS